MNKAIKRISPKRYFKKLSSQIVVTSLLISLLLINLVININPTASGTRATDDEPNNNFLNAVLLKNDKVIGGVDDLDQSDYYFLTVNPGQTIAIRLKTRIEGKNITLKLFNNDTDELWNSGLVSPDSVIYKNYTVNQNPSPQYYIGVFAEDIGNNYTLSNTIYSQDDAGIAGDGPDLVEKAAEIYGGTNNGFLADMDVDDFYMFKVNPGRIIDFNFSVEPDSDDADFNIYNDTLGNSIKNIQNVGAGKYVKFKYTTNSNGTRNFYINAHLVSGGRCNYSISLDVQAQQDGESYQDAGDDLLNPTPLGEKKVYKGWLASGKVGLDQVDVYNISIPIGNNTFYINFTPDQTLDLVIYFYNETFGVIASYNPNQGQRFDFKYIFNTTLESMVYILLKIADGKTSYGNYEIEFSYIKIKPVTGDTDNDNMPDAWEILYGLNPEDASDADKDKDSDTYTNLEEYLNSTDPTDPKDPPSGDINYSHLTEQAVSRSFSDKKKDVFHWAGTYDDSSGFFSFKTADLMNKPDYDIISLESARKDNELVIKLKVNGKIEDLGDIEGSGESDFETMTIYGFYFVDKSYEETDLVNNQLPQFLGMVNPLLPFPILYINTNFSGPPGTTGKVLESGQTLSWRIPLETLAELPADFGLYGFAYHFKVSVSNNTRATRASQSFSAYADTTGTGSKLHEIVIKLTKKILINDRNVSVIIDTDKEGGSVTVEDVEDPPDVEPPENVGSLEVYIDIQLTGGVEPTSIYVTIEYKDGDLPGGFDEKDIKLFYFDEDKNIWIKVKKSGVWKNNNTVWAEPEHLTVFAPMAERGAGGAGGEGGDDWGYLIIIIIIVIIIVVIVVGVGAVVARKRKRAERRPPPPPERPRRALTPEYFECPRCREEMEIPYSESEKVLLKCSECGAKGKIDNPYLGKKEEGLDYKPPKDHRDHESDYDRDRDRRQPPRESRGDIYGYEDEEELEYEPPRKTSGHPAKPSREISREKEKSEPKKSEELDDDYEYKKCPKCKEKIPIPYEEEDKILIKCPKCGAKGKVKNPYIN